MSDASVPSKNALKWMARRGMLELDLLFNGFIDGGYDQLTPEMQRVFVDFLQEQDPTLQGWLLGNKPASNPLFQQLVDQIKAHQVVSSQR